MNSILAISITAVIVLLTGAVGVHRIVKPIAL